MSRIEIAGVIRKAGYLEQTILAELKTWLAHGEWFRDVPEVRALLRKWHAGFKFQDAIKRTYEPRRNHRAWVDMAFDNYVALDEWKNQRKADPDFAGPCPAPLIIPRPRRPA